jgi:hypothetical protein
MEVQGCQTAGQCPELLGKNVLMAKVVPTRNQNVLIGGGKKEVLASRQEGPCPVVPCTWTLWLNTDVPGA